MGSEVVNLSEGQLQIRFVTTQEEYAVPDVPFTVPSDIDRKGFNILVNELLREHKLDIIKRIQFEFLICGEYLRVPLSKHLREKSVSLETTITVEYLESRSAPEPQDCMLHDDWVSTVNTDEKWILSGCYDGTVHIWTIKGKHKLVVHDHTSLVKCAKWINVADHIATFVSTSHDQTAMIWQWDIRSNKAVCRQVCRGHERGIDSVSLSPDKERMATGSWDTMLKLWSASVEDDHDGEPISKRLRGNQEHIRTPIRTLKGHKEGISSVVWTENDTVCTASMDHTIKLWDIELCGIRTQFVGPKAFFSVDWSDLNKMVIAGSADRHVRLFDPRSSEGTVVKNTFSSHTKWVQSVRWSKEEEYTFVSGGLDGQIKLWDIRSPKAELYDLTGHESEVLCCDWSNSKYIVSGGADQSVRVFKSNHATLSQD